MPCELLHTDFMPPIPLLLACILALTRFSSALQPPRFASALQPPHKVLQLPGLSQLAEAQFTGYLPTAANDSSPQLFYWLMESRSSPSKDPLVIWLQGGPGCSGGLGLLWEMGPCASQPQQLYRFCV